MGDCTYCGKSAGILNKEHKECRHTFDAGSQHMTALVSSTILQGKPLDTLESELEDIARSHFIDASQTRGYLIKGWELAAHLALDDHLLSKEEESRLVALQDRYSLSQEELNKEGAYMQVGKAAVLRDLSEGKMPNRLKVEGNLPFIFHKDEQLVWLFQRVEYWELKTRREYVGSSFGVSARVAKGLYVRSSSFRGHPVETTGMEPLDTGKLAVTDKSIYFAGSVKDVRIPYNKMVTLEGWTTKGIIICRDASTAKPQGFLTGDGWFTANLLSTLARK